jgi:Ala-tRNA(Pro) deacylase
MFDRIVAWLEQSRVVYRVVHHQPTRTSAESARARGEDISVGGKAIVMKVDDRFLLFVLSAALKVDTKSVREHFKARSIRFATSEELLGLTGLVPGSVPPFGRPILDLDLFADESVRRNEKIAFNAGSLTESIIMPTTDYLELARPSMFLFGKES